MCAKYRLAITLMRDIIDFKVNSNQNRYWVY